MGFHVFKPNRYLLTDNQKHASRFLDLQALDNASLKKKHRQEGKEKRQKVELAKIREEDLEWKRSNRKIIAEQRAFELAKKEKEI